MNLDYIKQYLVHVLLKTKIVEAELNSEEFNHDKNKKIFEYKNSWIKLFDKKFYYHILITRPICKKKIGIFNTFIF